MFNEEFEKEIEIVKSGWLSRATLNRARHNGLKFYRIGAYIAYKREDLTAWFCQPRSWKAAKPKGKGERRND